MKYLSVCSGIEAASAAWHPLGWEPVAFSEVDAFPSAVLKHHYPSVPNWGDMTRFQEWPDADVDVLVGGTPCQSFSVAGLRKGLDDPRGNLALTYLAILDRYRPRWCCWENVPGVLSSGGGRDFGAFLGGLGQLGYGFAYRVLDAQFFGVPQRRRRVFVVGCLGDWRRAAAVLFERESLSGHPAPRREARQGASAVAGIGAYRGGIARESDLSPSLQASGGEDERGIRNPVIAVQIAPCIPARRTAGGGLGTDFDCDGGLIPQIANPLTARMHKDINTTCDEGQTMIAHSLRADGCDASEDGTGRGTPLVPVTHALDSYSAGRVTEDGTGRGTPLVPTYVADIGMTLTSGGRGERGRMDPVNTDLVVHAFDARQSDVIQYGDQTGPLDTHRSSIGVMTLAIRGRADGAQLEVRDDGTANAVLTSSGGRGGIGVGAVAFSAKDYGADAGDIAPTLRAGGHTGSHANGGVMPAVAQHMAVRRLTPRECERLQGFPDDKKTITIRVCRSEDERRALALSAAKSSVAPKLEPSRHVAVDVRIDLERQHLQLRSLGKSNLSVSFADAASSSPLSIPLADFARLVAVTTSTLARETRTGEVASLLTINRSSAPWDGSVFVHLCGREIEELANDAEQFTTALSRSTKFITSEAGRSSQNSEQTLRTLCSCVAAVIASFIPEAIRAVSSFDLRLTTISGYTLIPYRGKPAADGPRYKALGNSMAVPVMHWIGKRIQMVEEL